MFNEFNKLTSGTLIRYEILEEYIFSYWANTNALFTFFNCILYTRKNSVRVFPAIRYARP